MGVDNTTNEDVASFRVADKGLNKHFSYLKIDMLDIHFVMILQLGAVLKSTNRREEGMQSDF